MAISNGDAISLRGLERSARMLMGGVAITAAFIGLTYKAGWISSAPDYDRQSWYLVSEHDGFTLTSRLEDEASCRKKEKAPAVCRSGSSLMDQAGFGSR